MYKSNGGQVNILSGPEFFEGVNLDPHNSWVELSQLIPWDEIEQKYAANFEDSTTGNPAKPARMAIGSLLIQERYGFSDVDITEEIGMHPYLQYFIGLPGFVHKAPFDASTLTKFRKRITPEMLQEINDIVIERRRVENQGEPPEGPKGEGTGSGEAIEGVPVAAVDPENNEGTLILDATCTPQNIRYPTDISLLNEAREKLESMVDSAHAAGCTEGKKPRTYRQRARKAYLLYARNRKPSQKQRRKALRKQLGYVARDLRYLKTILDRHPAVLTQRQRAMLETIRICYAQQQQMYDQRTSRVDDRIVSLHQPHVRPIKRGKVNRPTEFGAKIEVSLVNGYARIEDLRWNAFHEGLTLQASVERFRADTGHYPSRILADKIFRTRENLDYCKKHHIRMSGPKLGRPPKDPAVYREQRRVEREESGERSAIECFFGVGKRRYGLGRIMTRLQHTSEVSIHISVLTMNLFRKLRLSFILWWEHLGGAIVAVLRLYLWKIWRMFVPFAANIGVGQ